MTSAATKRLGALIVLVGAPALHLAIPGASWIRTSAAVAAGLMMIFFSRERIHDERVQDLKLKATSAAFSVSFAITLIVCRETPSRWASSPCDQAFDARSSRNRLVIPGVLRT